MSDHRHATDRYDIVVIAECPNECISMEFEATNSGKKTDGLLNLDFFETCPDCGADIDLLSQQKPTEILK